MQDKYGISISSTDSIAKQAFKAATEYVESHVTQCQEAMSAMSVVDSETFLKGAVVGVSLYMVDVWFDQREGG